MDIKKLILEKGLTPDVAIELGYVLGLTSEKASNAAYEQLSEEIDDLINEYVEENNISDEVVNNFIENVNNYSPN